MKKTVLVLCGGKSDEHEISLISAKNVLQALDRKKFEPIIVGISKKGQWLLQKESDFLHGEIRADKVRLNTEAPAISIIPHVNDAGRGTLIADKQTILFDVVFPILHGTFGEDGTVQGLLELMEIPFVGAGTGSSWLCMDKIFSKMLSRQNGFPTAEFVVLARKDELQKKMSDVKKLKYPLYVKPNRQGSSVGISRVTKESELEPAVNEAFKFDSRVLIEEGIFGREIECAVLGLNREAKVAPPGEIVPNPKIGFYSYEGKYLLEDGAELHAPAELSDAEKKKCENFALKIFDVLECDGLARVDLFLEKNTGEVFLNEVNTIPGFTPISMYPRMWQVGGLSYADLITNLIELAFKRRR